MKKWLQPQGANVLSMHGTAELGKGVEAAIRRQPELR
jgi:hypothetical protein